ncbi:MAG: response regulator transcription factor [Planctomycetota bacterium]
MIKILIVDDHAVVRQGVRQILAATFPKAEFGEAATAAEAMMAIRKHAWNIVVMDVGLPGRGGLDALKDIKAEFPKLPVLIQSMYGEDQYAIRAIRAGASGYVTKDVSADVLAGAVQKVLNGGKYISPSLGEALASEAAGEQGKPRHEELSDREYQVLRLIGNGKSVKEIGLQLSLSVKTVSTYRARILEKLNVGTTTELIHYALVNHIVE